MSILVQVFGGQIDTFPLRSIELEVELLAWIIRSFNIL